MHEHCLGLTFDMVLCLMDYLLNSCLASLDELIKSMPKLVEKEGLESMDIHLEHTL